MLDINRILYATDFSPCSDRAFPPALQLVFSYDDHLDRADRVFEKLEALTEPYQGPEVSRVSR